MFASLALLALAIQSPRLDIPPTDIPGRSGQPRTSVDAAGPQWAAACGDSTDWDQPAPPVRIHGNTYLVGTCGISAILVAGSDGHVLIDGGTEKGADVIAANIRALGFNLQDVKFLLHSHEHFDHVGGIAKLQTSTGATLVASAPAKAVLNSGRASSDDPQFGMHKPFAAARVGRVVKDGESIRLGNLLLTAMATPGHTAGALSWHWRSCEGAVCRTIFYADSLSAVSRDDYRFSDHPAYLAAYRASITKVAASRCDILLTPHPSASAMKERMAGEQALFDPEGCRDYAAALDRRLEARLAKENAR